MSISKTMLWLCLAMAGVVAMTGCSGCNNDPLVERDKKLEDEKKKKKPKEDFEFQLAHTVPADDTLAAPLVKPGHWVTVAHDLKANNRNVQAELHTTATDRNEKPFFVDDTPFMLSSSRPAPLPKGQEKRFETPYFIPRAAAGQTGKTVGLHRELRAAPSGNLLKKDWQPALNMEGYQYFFMVLAADPDRYGYLKRLPSVLAPTADDYTTDTYLYYRVILPQLERIAPLPANPLTWTSVAYILWDDADPNMLTPDQCQAMLDWLNWGGQLIISGPNTLEKLQGTFLEDYLPATVSKTIEIDQAAIDEINEYWALPDKKLGGKRTLDLLPGKPLIGVQLDKHPLAEAVANTGGLVVERQIGGGRIVVTAFSMSDRTIVNWTSFDSFFNGSLLRRPRRVFRYESLMADARWADYHHALVTDARLVTTLRYFTRDIGHFASLVRPRGYIEPGEEESEEVEQARRIEMLQDRGRRPTQEDLTPAGDDTHFLGYPFRPKSGMAAWNDQSGASDASREALKVAAGISIPKGEFVLKVLAVYLIVLAPVNWAFFRMMGRVEWAWVAAPIMAIIGAVAVVKLAQLDIGFARSVTEIGVVEAQGDYSRAHVTRYTALYTSLSSSYDLVFDDASSLAQPFSSNPDFTLGPHDPTYMVSLRRDKELRLSGFQVASNSTQTVHCEQMADLGGAFRLTGNDAEGLRLDNGTPIALKHVGLLRRTLGGEVQTCWIDDLPSGMNVTVRFESAADGQARLKQWDDASVTFSFDRQADRLLRQYDANKNKKLSREEVASVADLARAFSNFDRSENGRGDGDWDRGELLAWCRSSRFGELSLGQLVDLASLGLRLRPGDVRLVGWGDEDLPGMAIRPASAQQARRNLFLIHLKRGPLAEPRPDINTVADFAEEKPKAEVDASKDPENDKDAEKDEDKDTDTDKAESE